ncbi:Dna replication complex gins protein psf3 [Mycena indigotica]|uniref:DNA replication complex GINS protein PSF3 n=1 Tax=Mycena indigotica TaxID=2126181 RepID=A0A8H6SMA6_9AGAR|nr:Dna replication complex gins protein psf3 [Mycena indigotica]KAF7301455.1 Dna replication complex gins protein psf3 [Mycena indigotica]
MEDDYFSIDAILAENQRVGCRFKVDIPDMGHLGGGADRDIKKGTNLQLPIWLIYTVILSDWADMIMPPAFGAKVRNALNAEPCSVRLSGLVGAGGLWYGFGKTIMELLDNKADMSQLMTNTFRQRLIQVIDQAQHFSTLAQTAGDGAQSFREGLDGTERECEYNQEVKDTTH